MATSIMPPHRGVWVGLLCVIGYVGAGVPECPSDSQNRRQCLYEMNTALADVLQIRLQGDTTKIKNTPHLLEAYCNVDAYRNKSEHCGRCKYQVTITEPPEYKDTFFCAVPYKTSPYRPSAQMDLKHPLNGKEVELVRPLNMPFNQRSSSSYGCSAENWGDPSRLAGNIALSMYPYRGGCRADVHFRHAAAKGALAGLDVLDLNHYFYENLSPTVSHSSEGLETTPTFTVMGHPALTQLLSLPDSAVIKGRLDYVDCSSVPAERDWRRRDLSQYYGDECPWWFSQGDECKGVSDKCLYCPMTLHNIVGGQKGDQIACLYSPDILPQRREVFIHGSYELDTEIDVLYVPDDSNVARCLASDWAGFENQTVMLNWPKAGGICNRMTMLEAASSAGVKGLITTNDVRLWGMKTPRMKIPTASISSASDQKKVQEALRVTANYDQTLKAYRGRVHIARGAPAQKPATPAPEVTRKELPTVAEDNTDLFDEQRALTGVILAPLLLVMVIAKMASGWVATRRLFDTNRGMPLSVVSTLLAMACAVVLCLATYLMTESAGGDAVDTMIVNNERNVEFSSERNEINVDELTATFLKQLCDSINGLKGVYTEGGMQEAHSFLSNYKPASSSGPDWNSFLTFSRVTRASYSYKSTAQLLFHDRFWEFQFITQNGFYFDTNGVTTSATQAAWNGSLWANETARSDVFKRTAAAGEVPNWDVIGPQTVAQTQNGFYHDFTRSSLLTQRGGYNPAAYAFNSHLPAAKAGDKPYTDLYDYASRNWEGPLMWQGWILYSRYQLEQAWSSVTRNSFHYLTHVSYLVARSSDNKLLVALTKPTASFEYKLGQALDPDTARNPLRQNLTQLMYRAESDGGLIVFSTDVHATIADVVMHPTTRQARLGTLVHSVYDSGEIHVTAMARCLVARYGTINPEHPDVRQRERGLSTFTFEFDQADYYTGPASVLMYLSFENSDTEVSGERWETVTVQRTLDTTGRASDLQATPQYANGVFSDSSAMMFDGEKSVVVYPYLTRRVPRVRETQIGSDSDAWQSAAAAYGKVGVHDGIDGVILDVNPNDGTTSPFLRNRFEFKQDFSVSMYIRPQQGSGIYGSKLSAQRLFTDAEGNAGIFAVYADGTVRVSLVNSYGCYTNSIDGAVPYDQWTFVVATVSFNKKTCSVHANGAHLSTGRMSDIYAPTVMGGNYSIGAGFVGLIDEVRVHNRSLTEDDAAHLYSTYNAHAHDATKKGTELTVKDVSVRSKRWVVAMSTHQLNVGDVTDKRGWSTNAVMVPVEDVRREVDATTKAILSAVKQQQDVTSGRLDRKKKEVVIVVIALALAVMLIFLLLNDVVTKPFSNIAMEINGVAYMDLTCASPEQRSSVLLEIAVMSKAMSVLVRNMIEYRNYMPLSMLNQINPEHDSDEDTTAEDERSVVSGLGSRCQTSSVYVPPAPSSSSGSSSAMRAQVRTGANVLLAQSLSRKKMTFAVLNLGDFHQLLHEKADAAMREHAAYLTAVTSAVDAQRGLPESFSGDKVFVTFNGAKPATQHATLGAGFAVSLTTMELADCSRKINVGLATGEVRAGNAGINSLRRYTCFGRAVLWAHLLERYGRLNGLRVITDNVLGEALVGRFDIRHVSIVQPIKGDRRQHALTTTVLHPITHQGDEWMYQLQEAERSTANWAWNKVMDCIYVNKYAEAKAQLSELSETDTNDSYYPTLCKFIDTEKVQPEFIRTY